MEEPVDVIGLELRDKKEEMDDEAGAVNCTEAVIELWVNGEGEEEV